MSGRLRVYIPYIFSYPLRGQLHRQLHQVLEHSRDVEHVRVVKDNWGATLKVMARIFMPQDSGV